MRTRSKLAAYFSLCFLTLTGRSQVGADGIYSTGFEEPTFTVGTNLLGNDGWSLAIPPFLNGGAAKVTNSQSAGGAQSVAVLGQNLVDTQSVIDPSTGSPYPADTTAPYAAIGSYRRPVNYDTAASGLPLVQLRANIRVDGAITPNDDSHQDNRRFAASLAARSAGDGGYAELEIASNGTVSLFTSLSGEAVKTSPISLNAWHELGIDVDYGLNQFTFWVDQANLGVYPFDPANTSDVLGRGALVAYAMPDDDTLGFHRGDYQAYFDDFSILSVPEPYACPFLAAAVGFLWLRRKPD